jgi:hypothetical protein
MRYLTFLSYYLTPSSLTHSKLHIGTNRLSQTKTLSPLKHPPQQRSTSSRTKTVATRTPALTDLGREPMRVSIAAAAATRGNKIFIQFYQHLMSSFLCV